MELKFDIIKEIAILSESKSGWKKEINLISWNESAPKYDIRDWAPNHEKMSKGITLTEDELKKLVDCFSSNPTEEEQYQMSMDDLIIQENCAFITIDELMDSWDDYVQSAPESIRDYLMSSHLNRANANTLIVILRKGTAFNKLSEKENKDRIVNYISKIVGECVNIELLESAWL